MNAINETIMDSTPKPNTTGYQLSVSQMERPFSPISPRPMRKNTPAVLQGLSFSSMSVLSILSVCFCFSVFMILGLSDFRYSLGAGQSYKTNDQEDHAPILQRYPKHRVVGLVGEFSAGIFINAKFGAIQNAPDHEGYGRGY